MVGQGVWVWPQTGQGVASGGAGSAENSGEGPDRPVRIAGDTQT